MTCCNDRLEGQKCGKELRRLFVSRQMTNSLCFNFVYFTKDNKYVSVRCPDFSYIICLSAYCNMTKNIFGLPEFPLLHKHFHSLQKCEIHSICFIQVACMLLFVWKAKNNVSFSGVSDLKWYISLKETYFELN